MSGSDAHRSDPAAGDRAAGPVHPERPGSSADAPSPGSSPVGHPPPSGAAGPGSDSLGAEHDAGGSASGRADLGEGEEVAGGGVEEAEALIEADLAAVLQERDEYLDALRRLQADFENYRKRVVKQQTEHLEHAAAGLVEKLLPALDAADAALAHGADAVEPVLGALLGVLEKEGLERLDPEGKPFDPEEHEAVAHEPADGDGDGDGGGAVVAEVLRRGYRWRGRVLRPAMVKVRG